MGALTDTFAAFLRKVFKAWPEQPTATDMNELLRLLGRWRSLMLVNTYIQREGTVIHSGIFKGMDYVQVATEGALIPRLLGTYESELHPYLRGFAQQGLDCVIDIGCAEGYYAVGLARMMPEVTVYAHDIDENARKACAVLAAKNGVSERVKIGGEFKPTDFEGFAGRRVLVMIDAEGAELDVLRPDLSPALAQMSLIVETHDVVRPGAFQEISRRFSPTHDLIRVDTGPKTFDMPGWLKDLNHLDQLLAVWEWRMMITPWLVMTPKA